MLTIESTARDHRVWELISVRDPPGSFIICSTSGPKGSCQKSCKQNLKMITTFKKALTRVNSRAWLAKFFEPVSQTSRSFHPHQTIEEADFYSTGGFHPVSLGDTFNSGTYKVVRKLGYGQYSTVWLARDSK